MRFQDSPPLCFWLSLHPAAEACGSTSPFAWWEPSALTLSLDATRPPGAQEEEPQPCLHGRRWDPKSPDAKEWSPLFGSTASTGGGLCLLLWPSLCCQPDPHRRAAHRGWAPLSVTAFRSDCHRWLTQSSLPCLPGEFLSSPCSGHNAEAVRAEIPLSSELSKDELLRLFLSFVHVLLNA